MPPDSINHLSLSVKPIAQTNVKLSKQERLIGSMKDQLINKLDIRGGLSVKFINEPNYYSNILGQIPADVKIFKRLTQPVDWIHLFTKSRKELMVEFPALKKYVMPNGTLWISWPKKSSNLVTDLTKEIIREIGINNNFVNSDECEIDDNWNGMKFINSRGGN